MPDAVNPNLCLFCGQQIDPRAVRCIYCMKEVGAQPGTVKTGKSQPNAVILISIIALMAGGQFLCRQHRGSANLEGSKPLNSAYSLRELDQKLHSDRSEESQDESQTGYNDQRLNDAVGEWTKAIEANPKNAQAYLERGWAYNELQQYENAIYDLSKAIKLNPKLATAYSRRAWVHDTRGEYQKALADASRAIQLNPNIAEAYQARACAYASLGESKKAESDSASADRLGSELSR